MANTTKKTTTAKAKASTEKKTTKAKAEVKEEIKEEVKAPVQDEKDVLIAELKKQMDEMKAQMEQMKSAQPTIISTDVPKVYFLWQAEIADDNVVTFGENGMYGRIVGKTGSFFVPKNELSRIMDSMTRMFLDKRWLIVVSGLDESEREALNVDYKEGEILDRQAFAKIVEMGEGILEIFPKLCDSHKEMVARRYYEAYENKSFPINRDIIIALYKEFPSEAFKAIKEGLDAEELE